MTFKQILVSTLSAGALLAAGTIAANADTNVTVQSGDTVSELATANGSTIDAIVNANQLTNGGNLIYVGQTLVIPDGNTTATAAPATTSASTTAAPVAQATTPAAPAATSQAQTQPTATVTPAPATTASTTTPAASSSDEAAKAYIASGESGGSYTATNGQYIGKYQLTSSYLHGDYSAANQEAVATQYAISRYGSWTAAAAYWSAHHSW